MPAIGSGTDEARRLMQEVVEMERRGADPMNILSTLKIVENCDSDYPGLKEKISFYLKYAGGMYRGEAAVPLPPPIQTTRDEGFAVLTPDSRTLIFTSNRAGSIDGSEDFWIATKSGKGWGEPRNMGPRINTSESEGAATLTPDGREIFFSRTCQDGGLDLYHANFLGNDWSAPTNLGPLINSPYWDSHPSISADGKSLYFSSTRPGGIGKRDIWVAKRNSAGTWISVENLGPNVNSTGDDISPFIHYDGETLYFCSDRPGGCGQEDVYFTKRVDGSWQTPVNLGPGINTSDSEYQYSITFRGDSALFSRKTDQRGMDIFTIPVPASARPRWTAYVRGTVRDAKTGRPVSAEVTLSNLKNTESILTTQSNPLIGEYLVVLIIGNLYDLRVQSDGYLKFEETFDLTQALPMQRIDKDFALFPVEKKEIIKGVVWDYYDSKPLGGVMVTVENAETGDVVAVVYTDYETGQYVAEVPSGGKYRMSASRDRFWPAWIERLPDKPTETADFSWDFHLQQFSRTAEDKKPYVVQNIYFDKDSTGLRPESFGVLNRLFREVLQKYPDYGFKIMGHTDSDGSDEYNLKLSRGRAEAVRQFWSNQGIPTYRMIGEGYGKTKPVAPNDTDENKQKNRRTELLALPLQELYQ